MALVSKNSNVIRVPALVGVDFFYKWLWFLTPLHRLTNMERQVLAIVLNKRHELSEIVNDDTTLDELVLSTKCRREIKDEMNATAGQINIIFTKLRRCNVFVDGRINKRFIPNIEKGSKEYRLMLIFDVNEKPIPE